MECKVLADGKIDEDERDLIDTLWNVKFIYELDELKQWTGFNRYIVECKDGNADGTQRQRIRI